MIYWFKLVPVNFEFIIPSIILIISAISYSNSNVMTSDNFYKGFPCVWNILVFYLYIFDFSQIFNLLLISISILIGLGYYVSSISLIVIFFLIDYFFEGVFDFFINEDKDAIEEREDMIAEIENIDIDVIDEN